MGVDIRVLPDPDEDDCLAVAAAELAYTLGVETDYDFSPRWESEEREAIILTVPDWAAEDLLEYGYEVVS